MTKSLFEMATNPTQYDDGEVVWAQEGDGDNPIRQMFLETLPQYLGDIKGTDTLDVGCGTGWLCNVMAEAGAQATGIDGSASNIAIAKKLYPALPFEQCGLYEYEPNKQFDTVTCVMAFEHMPSADEAFNKVHALLKPAGKMILIAGDYEKFIQPRFGYTVQTEPITPGETATRTDYGDRMGVLYDVFRTTERITLAAENAGLSLAAHVPIAPSESLIRQHPKYTEFQGEPIFHLYEFKT